MIAGVSGLYEVLLIVLVVVLIFNGLLRSKVLSKINDNLDRSNQDSSSKDSSSRKEGEYVDFEVISENTNNEKNKLD